MFPVLIDLGRHDLPLLGDTHVFLPSYGFLFALAVLVAWWWFTRRGRTLGIDDEILFNLTFYSLLAGILGAKLLLVLLDWRRYVEDPTLLWGTIRSAGVLAGGVALAAVVFVLYARRRGLAVLPLADAVVAPLALAQAIGRVGCLCAGCCWGVPASEGSRFAVRFTHPLANTGWDARDVPLVPVQAIEMLFDLLLAVGLTVLWRRRPRPAGTVLWVYLVAYGLGRGILEFWRGDVERGLFLDGRLSTSQGFALAAVVLGAVMLVRGRLRSSAASE